MVSKLKSCLMSLQGSKLSHHLPRDFVRALIAPLIQAVLSRTCGKAQPAAGDMLCLQCASVEADSQCQQHCCSCSACLTGQDGDQLPQCRSYVICLRAAAVPQTADTAARRLSKSLHLFRTLSWNLQSLTQDVVS